VTIENKVWYLRRNRLFERVGEDVLHGCLHFFTVTRRSVRTELFDQGADAGTVYFLKEGRVRLSRITEGGKGITIAVLGPGDVFGEEGLFGTAERTTIATVIDDALVCTSSAEDLLSLMGRQPVLALNMARYFQEQRDEAVSMLEEMAYLKVPERLVKLLERLAHEHGVVEDGGVRIGLRLTQTDIASLVGSTRETISVELTKLTNAKRLIVRDREFFLPNATVSG